MFSLSIAQLLFTGSKVRMQLDKTKFAKETGSEDIDLGSFIEDDDNDKENIDFDDDFIPKLSARRQSTSSKPDDSQENMTSKSSKPTNQHVFKFNDPLR